MPAAAVPSAAADLFLPLRTVVAIELRTTTLSFPGPLTRCMGRPNLASNTPSLATSAAALLALPLLASSPGLAEPAVLEPYAPDAGCAMLQAWYDELLATHPEGTAVPLKIDEPTDVQLAMLGLPPRHVLLAQRYPAPTLVLPDGTTEALDPARLALGGDLVLASYAGAGCLGIRPGALLLNLNGGIAVCSMAHVYGAPGSYQISTAGHCTEKTGEVMTVVAAVGNRNSIAGPVLLDFGTTSRTTGDAGIGRDWALISVAAAYQDLVSPTMCFWAGPRGLFTAQGEFVDPNINRRLVPSVSVNPDPALVQGIVHFGHGLGLGAGGTPRSGASDAWTSTYFVFVGAIAPGDSGSAANTGLGQAAGIITHVVVDPWLRTGTGLALGTRATQVHATLADGQLVAYPVPAAGLP